MKMGILTLFLILGTKTAAEPLLFDKLIMPPADAHWVSVGISSSSGVYGVELGYGRTRVRVLQCAVCESAAVSELRNQLLQGLGRRKGRVPRESLSLRLSVHRHFTELQNQPGSSGALLGSYSGAGGTSISACAVSGWNPSGVSTSPMA
jgi:hypothetical protein